MESRLKTTALLCAAAWFGVLTLNASFAQQGREAATSSAHDSGGYDSGGHDGAGHGEGHGGGADGGLKDAGSGDKGGAKGSGPDGSGTSASPNASSTTQGEQNQSPKGHASRGTGGADGTGHDGVGRGANHNGGTVNPNGSGPVAKGAAGEHSIDLVRPDDGYASLHRRAIRKSLIATAPKKTIIPSGHLAVRPQGPPATAGGGVVRNALGIAPSNGGTGTPPEHHPPGFMAHAVAGTTPTVAPVTEPHVLRPADPPVHTALAGTGINGSNFGHLAAGPGAVGGPAKLATGINGSSIRRRY